MCNSPCAWPCTNPTIATRTGGFSCAVTRPLEPSTTAEIIANTDIHRFLILTPPKVASILIHVGIFWDDFFRRPRHHLCPGSCATLSAWQRIGKQNSSIPTRTLPKAFLHSRQL